MPNELRDTVLIIHYLPKILTYYSSIIPNSFRCLLFSKLCQHNLSRPSWVQNGYCKDIGGFLIWRFSMGSPYIETLLSVAVAVAIETTKILCGQLNARCTTC